MKAALCLVFTAVAIVGLSSPVVAQDIPDAPIPAGSPTDPVIPPDVAPVDPGVAAATPDVPAALAAAAPAGPAAPLLAAFDEVEVEDPVEPGFWDRCTVIEAFQGAYEVSCNSTRSIRRDIHVRPVGGQPVAQTAAKPVTGEPFTRGSLVLASIMGLPDHWQLCVVQRNNVATTNSYEVQCAGSKYNVLPRWLRVDPKAPAA